MPYYSDQGPSDTKSSAKVPSDTMSNDQVPSDTMSNDQVPFAYSDTLSSDDTDSKHSDGSLKYSSVYNKISHSAKTSSYSYKSVVTSGEKVDEKIRERREGRVRERREGRVRRDTEGLIPPDYIVDQAIGRTSRNARF